MKKAESSWTQTKKTIILNTKIHLGYGFPCEPGTSRNQRLNDVRNNEKMTENSKTTNWAEPVNPNFPVVTLCNKMFCTTNSNSIPVLGPIKT